MKHNFLKISVDLKRALLAEAHASERQRLDDQLRIEELRLFEAGTRVSTVSLTDTRSSALINIYEKTVWAKLPGVQYLNI
jgi:hypothetical protein